MMGFQMGKSFEPQLPSSFSDFSKKDMMRNDGDVDECSVESNFSEILLSWADGGSTGSVLGVGLFNG